MVGIVEALFVVWGAEFGLPCVLFWLNDTLDLGFDIWVSGFVAVLLEFDLVLLIVVEFELEAFCFYWLEGTNGDKVELKV